MHETASPQAAPPDRLISDSTTEHFISKLTNVYSRRGQNEAPVGGSVITDGGPQGDGAQIDFPLKHTYIPLDYDNTRKYHGPAHLEQVRSCI